MRTRRRVLERTCNRSRNRRKSHNDSRRFAWRKAGLFLPQSLAQLRQPPQSHFHYYNSAVTATAPPPPSNDERESLIQRNDYNRHTSMLNSAEARKCWNVIQWTMVAIVLAFIIVESC